MLASIPVRGRLRTSTMVMPIALATSTKIRNCTRRPPRLRDASRPSGPDRLRTRRPVGAVGPVFLLPDRHALLDPVDAGERGRERFGAVRARDDDRDRGLREREPPSRCTTATRSTLGPLGAHRRDDLGHPSLRGLLVRLVRERDDVVAAFGMVADNAEERDDGSADGRRRPRDERVERDRVRLGARSNHAPSGDGWGTGTAAIVGTPRPQGPFGLRGRRQTGNDPSVHSRRERRAFPIVGRGPRAVIRGSRRASPRRRRRGRRRSRRVRAAGGPPHPMDRVWRHPSELPALGEPGDRERRKGPAIPAGVRPFAPRSARRRGRSGALLTVGVLAAAGVLDQDRGTIRGRTSRPARDRRPTAIADDRPSGRAGHRRRARRSARSGGARTGSGVCIRHAGQVLTSDRLVAGASRIEIVTSDGRRYRRARRHRPRPGERSRPARRSTATLEAADLAAAGITPVSASRCTPSAPTRRDRHG